MAWISVTSGICTSSITQAKIIADRDRTVTADREQRQEGAHSHENQVGAA